ncbi:MAG: right-handed parallel beta-helix repeat-containing protein [Armatimonadota bacterium]
MKVRMNGSNKAKLVVLFVLASILCLATATMALVPEWMTRPGTVANAISQDDDTHVYLDAVVIDKIITREATPYFTVRETWNATSRVCILAMPNELLRRGQLLDIDGYLTTLPSGERAIKNVIVWGYTDKDGTLLVHGGPTSKGIMAPQPWDYKVDLTEEYPLTKSNTQSELTTDTSTSDSEPNSSPAEPPTYYQSVGDVFMDTTEAQPQMARLASLYDGIGEVTGLADYAKVEFQCKRIIGYGTDTVDSVTYKYIDIADDLPSADWIRCYYSGSFTISTDDRVNRITGQIQHVNSVPVICVNDGPGYDPQVLEGVLQITTHQSIGWAKTFADGTTLPLSLDNKVVSRSYPSIGYFYVQEPGRSSGIRIYNQTFAQAVQPGTTITISGAISSLDGERLLTPTNVTITGSTDPPGTLGMNNRVLGGGGFNVYTPGITGSFEMPNVGLFVRICGRVTSVDPNTDPHYFYLDDGSNVNNGEGSPRGVKVSWEWHGSQDGNPPIAAPEEGWYVCANGISSSEISGSQTVRVLRLRRQEDMRVVQPEDSTDPYVDMTTPPRGEVHTGQTTIQISGTATDADTGVVSVQVGFTATRVDIPPTTWSVADYNHATHIWSLGWQNPQTQRVWIKATDFTGRTSTINQDITVSAVTVIYVNGSDPNACDDANHGASWQLPKKTVIAAMTAAAPGQEIWVATGKYQESASISLKDGVGLYGGFVGTEDSRELRNSTLYETILDGSGTRGVVTVSSGATITTVIDGFVIRNGKSGYGGGINCSNASATVIHNVIITNSSKYNGGGIYCSNSSAIIKENLIAGNVGSHGGGICCSNSPVIIANNRIAGNGLNYQSGNGGGIYCYGSSPVITNNTIIGNTSPYYGGGIYTSSSSAVFTNNTLSDNSAYYGGAIYCYSGNPTLSNNILSFNSSGVHNDNATVTLRNNCVFGNNEYNYSSGLSAGQGDISQDPLFADRSYGNFHMQSGSPCINAGWNSASGLPSVDMDNQPRILPEEGTVDIGADESDGTIWPTGSTNIIYVSPEGNDMDDGSSWSSAKQTVQAAINATTGQGGQVWVRAGTYREAVTLLPCVHLFGGFAGSEANLSERNWKDNITFLDGYQTWTVVVMRGCCSIDGFTISNGKADEWNDIPAGAIFCDCSSGRIANNVITGNWGNRNGAAGGIYCDRANPTIINNRIVGNGTGDNGGCGGIYCTSASPIIANNSISANCGGTSGGIYIDGGSPAIINNTITDNRGGSSGGIYYSYYCSVTAVNNIIAYNSYGIYSYLGGITLKNNCIYGNDINFASGWNPIGQNGNISADPKLASRDYGNMHIMPDSPCIGTGNNGYVQSGWVDLDGQSRLQPTGGNVDIGADESDGTIPDVSPSIVRVSQNGDDADDGSTWQSTMRTIQAAIGRASADGGEVWVKEGEYPERLSLSPFVYVYGGFCGEEVYEYDRDTGSSGTIIDGQQGGSVVTIATAGPTSIDGFTIKNGKAQYGAGIYCNHGFPSIANNTITANTATYDGGGIYCTASFPKINNNIITANSAGGTGSYDGGGGIYISGGTPNLTNNTLTSNNAMNGGGLYLYSAQGIAANNCFTANSATNGSAVYCYSASSSILNNTIAVNYATGTGAGIYCDNSAVSISNNIVSFNSSGIYKSGINTPTLRNNCVYANTIYNYSGITDPTGTNGNISIDPKFANYTTGDVHIQSDSPCVGTGNNTFVQSDWLDIDGDPRIYPEESTVDIGADESDGTIWSITPRVVMVSPDGDDANDGSSWEVAKRTVQAGIDSASAVGGEVWVRSGTYTESIILPSYVQVYGGFCGSEENRTDRDWTTNVTVLGSPGITGRIVTIDGGQGCIVDGFTIQYGSATKGGGIYCNNASATISNNTIKYNTASADGAGIYCYNSLPTILNNWVVGNRGFRSDSRGGGIYCENSNGKIVGNTITSNTASTYGGGGIYLRSITSALVIANNIISSNSSGIYKYESGQPTFQIRNNDVWSNGSSNYSWTPTPSGDISSDPKIASVNSDPHIQPGSPCKDAGWNSAPGLPDVDIDGQSRTQDNIVDIGADETDGSSWNTINITANPPYCAVGDNLTYTITLKDSTGQPIAGTNIIVQITGSSITNITNNVVTGTIDEPPVSGSCATNDSGQIYVTVVAGIGDEGNLFMNISAQVAGASQMMSMQSASQTSLASASLSSFCYDPNAEVGLVICFDVTGSMSNGASAKGGLEELINYIRTHTPWVKIAGIKVLDELCNTLDFTRDFDAVTTWIDLGNQSGSSGDDGPELQLDALASANDMLSGTGRKLIALATNSEFHFAGDGTEFSVYIEAQVISLLSTSGAEVYIDGDTASDNYIDLAINGSIEDDLGAYYFPRLKEALLQGTKLDLDVDSDNNNGDDPPDRSSEEDSIEATMAKQIQIDSDDIDDDDIPGFADGFNWDDEPGNNDDISAQTEFVPLVLDLERPLEPSDQIELIYDASDPLGVTREGEDPDFTYTPAPGTFRIWTKNGDQARDPANVTQGGDYVPSGTFTASQLGFTSNKRTVTLYIEAVQSQTEEQVATAMRSLLSSTTTSNDEVKVRIGNRAKDKVKVKACFSTLPQITAVYVAYRTVGTGTSNMAFPYDNTDVVIKAMVVATVNGQKRVYTDLGDKDTAESGWRDGGTWHIYGAQGSNLPNDWPDYRWLSDESSKFSRIYQWDTANWGIPTFTWRKRYHHCYAKGESGRKYDYRQAAPSTWSGWGTTDDGIEFGASGLVRLRVTVQLDNQKKTSLDNEKATRIAVRDHRNFGITNDRRINYLRWIFAYKGEPYEFGGYWFGGRSTDSWHGGSAYSGYGVDCRGLVSQAARWAGYNWGNNQGLAWVHSTPSLYTGNTVTTEAFPEDDPFGPGDILCYCKYTRRGHEGHVVSVYYRDGDNISIIEAAGGSPNRNPPGSVVRIQENQSLEDWLNDPYDDPTCNYKQFRLVVK